jgi:PKD repeat protein
MGAVPTAWRRTTKLTDTTYPITVEPVANIEASIIPTVGASRRLACDGTWVMNRDSVDTRLINQYNAGVGDTALPVTEADVGGFPTISNGTPCLDTDHDGMPDVWETANGFNPNNIADRNTVASNGFTNLENYLNSSVVTVLPPTAAFTATPLSGNTPLGVAFTNSSSGYITNHLWNFGDGTPTSTSANPTHTYTVAGTYTVSLTETGGTSSDVETKTNYITVTDSLILYPPAYLRIQ